ncbi:MAG: hypothetical protein WCH37_08570 [Synechococcaceae cyanobacterium ELA182]
MGAGSQSIIGFVPAALSLIGLGIYALLTAKPENNDDDDSSPGGGLMQPVA